MVKKAISAASAILKSTQSVTAVSPKDPNVPTVGVTLTPKEAVGLATKLLAVSQAENAKGKRIYVTARNSQLNVTIIRNLK